MTKLFWFKVNTTVTFIHIIYRLLCEKTCLWRFTPDHTQTSLLSYRDKLENRNLACSKYRHDTFARTNIKGNDQTVPIHRLVCAVVHTTQNRFSHKEASMIKQQTNLLTYMHRDQHFLSSNATENETDTVCDIYV